MTTLTAKHNGHTSRHHLTSRKDHRMFGIELRLAAINERQSLERSFRAADRLRQHSRARSGSRWASRSSGQSRRVAGEPSAPPPDRLMPAGGAQPSI